jgi:hypothetical protein
MAAIDGALMRLFLMVSIVSLLIALPVSKVRGEAEEGDDPHLNWAALFIGMTGENRRDTGFALGIEYARHLNPSFAVGAVAERTFGDLDFWVFAVPFAYRTGPWKFYIAPGVEDADFSGGGEFLLRLGGEYAFEVGEWEIAPQLDVDFVDGDQVLVLGVTIGKSY